MQKENELPCPVSVLSNEALNDIYLRTVNSPVDDYIAGIMQYSVNQVAPQFPQADWKSVVKHVTNTAMCEEMAYANQTNVLKTALSLNCPTDLDYRLLLYDRFIKVSSAIENSL